MPRPTPELEASAAQLVEHADLLDQPQRMVQRQRVDQRAEAQVPRALGHRGEENLGEAARPSGVAWCSAV